jgi:hypothetical protein
VHPAVEGFHDHIPFLPSILYSILPVINSTMAIITPNASTHGMLSTKKKHNAIRNTVEPDPKRERELKPSVSLDVKPETCQARRRGMAKIGKACDRCKLKKCKVDDTPGINPRMTLNGFAV